MLELPSGTRNMLVLWSGCRLDSSVQRLEKQHVDKRAPASDAISDVQEPPHGTADGPDREHHMAFAPVIHSDARLLILGSLPGRRSLAEGRYYAHPVNQFWRLLGPVIGVDLQGLGYSDRLATLLEHGIGLWDVIASATRPGSLDSAIRDPQFRDTRAMIDGLPALRAVAFNGGTAWRHGQRQLGDVPGLATLALPSSSAAHAIGITAKQDAWQQLGAYLG